MVYFDGYLGLGFFVCQPCQNRSRNPNPVSNNCGFSRCSLEEIFTTREHCLEGLEEIVERPPLPLLDEACLLLLLLLYTQCVQINIKVGKTDH